MDGTKKGKVGLMLEGGGAKGAYEAGVVKYLIRKAGLEFDTIIGSSVGALNAVLTAADEIERMERIWLNISSKQIYSFDFSVIFKLGIFNQNFFSNHPLEKLMEKELTKEAAQKIIDCPGKLLITATSLETGEEIILKNFKTREEIIKALLASSAIPVVFPPQEMVINGKEHVLCDGGVGNNAPIKNAIEAGCETVYAVLVESLSATNKKKPFNWLDIMMRTLDILMKDSVVGDLKYADYISRVIRNQNLLKKDVLSIVAKECGDEALKKKIEEEVEKSFNLHNDPYGKHKELSIKVIKPAKDLAVNVIDFNKEKSKELFDLGMKDAEKAPA